MQYLVGLISVAAGIQHIVRRNWCLYTYMAHLWQFVQSTTTLHIWMDQRAKSMCLFYGASANEELGVLQVVSEKIEGGSVGPTPRLSQRLLVVQ